MSQREPHGLFPALLGPSQEGSQGGSQHAQSSGHAGRRPASIAPGKRHTGRHGAPSGDWVELIWEQEAAGSNPAIPTEFFECAIDPLDQGRQSASVTSRRSACSASAHVGSHPPVGLTSSRVEPWLVLFWVPSEACIAVTRCAEIARFCIKQGVSRWHIYAPSCMSPTMVGDLQFTLSFVRESTDR